MTMPSNYLTIVMGWIVGLSELRAECWLHSSVSTEQEKTHSVMASAGVYNDGLDVFRFVLTRE